MTRDEIIQLAREADMIDFRDEDSDLHVVQFVDFLASVIGKAVAAEREECAKACEVKAHSWPYPSHDLLSRPEPSMRVPATSQHRYRNRAGR